MLELLRSRLAAMGLPADPEKVAALAEFHAILTEANARMNLTRVPEDINEAVDRNYLDSLSALPLLADLQNCVDIGSGAGFPGVPLSIYMPETRFLLMDSQAKRVGFLKRAIGTLKLDAEATALRAEDAGVGGLRESFDAAVSRAVAPMNVLAELMLPLVKVGGRMLAWKGPGVSDELDGARAAIELLGGRVERVFPVEIPGRDWAHNIVAVEKIARTPGKYPRRAGVPEKRPL